MNQEAATTPAPEPTDAPRPKHPMDTITDVNALLLDRTGRVTDRTRERAAAFLTSAMGLGYPHPMFPGNKPITGKVLRKERLRVLRWMRENRPDVVARGKELQREFAEDSDSSQSPQTSP